MRQTSVIRRFLVSGSDKQLCDFHYATCFFMNAIERRGQTVLFTCPSEHAQNALEIAGRTGVTVQEWNDYEWEAIVKGGHPGWLRKGDAS